MAASCYVHLAVHAEVEKCNIKLKIKSLTLGKFEPIRKQLSAIEFRPVVGVLRPFDGCKFIQMSTFHSNVSFVVNCHFDRTPFRIIF
jgi:hypothetical protein